jgi:Ca2+-transporting ATPase
MWMALASITVLAIILYVPVISTLFAFSLPSPTLLSIGLGVALISTLWFEAVKRAQGAKATGLH